MMGPLADLGYALESQGKCTIAHALKVILYVFCVIFDDPGLRSPEFSGRTKAYYDANELDTFGIIIKDCLMQKMVGLKGYLDDFELVCSYLQCTLCDPYNKSHEMERIISWIDGLVAGGWLPGIADKAAKL